MIQIPYTYVTAAVTVVVSVKHTVMIKIFSTRFGTGTGRAQAAVVSVTATASNISCTGPVVYIVKSADAPL